MKKTPRKSKNKRQRVKTRRLEHPFVLDDDGNLILESRKIKRRPDRAYVLDEKGYVIREAKTGIGKSPRQQAIDEGRREPDSPERLREMIAWHEAVMAERRKRRKSA